MKYNSQTDCVNYPNQCSTVKLNIATFNSEQIYAQFSAGGVCYNVLFQEISILPLLAEGFQFEPSSCPFGDSTSSSHFPLNIIIILSVRHPSPLGISSDLLRAGRDILIIETTKFVLLLLTLLPVISVCELLTSDCRRGSSFLRRYQMVISTEALGVIFSNPIML